MDTISKALTKIANIYNVTDIDSNDTAADIIDKIAGGMVFGSSNVTVAAATKSSYWGTQVSAMQTSLAVSNGKITGTLHKLTSGQLVTDWGEGYFMALKFTKDNAAATSIKVGLNPSQGSGLVELDADMDGVFKVTNKDSQKFEVLTSNGNVDFAQFYDLSELVLSEE